MRKSLEGRVALVTGSSRGIGRATAEALAARGARVVLNGRDGERLQRAQAEMAEAGLEVATAAGDVADLTECRRVVEQAAARWGRLDILVNNAGTSARGRFAATEPEVFRQVITSNVLGPMFATRLALPHLQKTAGSVVFVSSLAGLHGIPGGAAYSTAKMALTALAQSLRAESSAVHVGVLYVGFTRNDPGKLFFHPDGSLGPITRPFRYSLTPEQVGEAIAVLIDRRRPSRVLTGMGWTIAALRRVSPRLLEALVAQAGRRVDPLGE
jgi:meso-butanediol dehydrogenase/(S,S)-butanediol dehydrogenase/diacetyl reductase